MPTGALGSASASAVSSSSGITGSMLASTFLLAGSQALGILTAPGVQRGTAAELAYPPGEASDVIPYVCGEVEVVPHFVTYFGYQNKKVKNDVAQQEIIVNSAIQAMAGYITGGGTVVSSPPTAIYLAMLGGMLGAITAGLGQLRTASYRHYCGFFYQICHGPIDGISAVKVDERPSFAGSDSNAGSTILIDDPQAWGGDHFDGGTYWLCDIVRGDFWPTQQPNAHLVEMLGADVPAYSGKACFVIHAPTVSFPESGYFAANPGAAPALRPIKLRVHRYPNNLGVPEFKKVNVSGNHADANLAECCYEWLTNPAFGVRKLSSSRIDLDSFRLGAETHYNDNLGVSLQFNTPTDVESALDTFTAIGDAIIYGSLRRGTLKYKVIKRDYSTPDLKTYKRGYDGSDPNTYNVIRIGQVSHGAWARTGNNFTFRYKDRDNNFIDTARPTPELANFMMQGRVRSVDQTMEGVSNGDSAAFVGTREMRAGSYPNDPITFVVNRDGFDDEPGDVVKLIDNELDFQKIIRISDVRAGTEDTSEIEIVGLEDQYGIGASAYNPYVPPGFTDPVGTAAAAAHSKVIEAPYFLTRDDEARLLVFAGKPNGAQINFDTYVSTDGGTTYVQEGSNTDFAITGVITEAIERLTDPVLAELTFTPTNSFDATRLEDATADEIANGKNILYFEATGEFMAVETRIDNGDGTYTLQNVWRAVHPFDSVPTPHSAGSRVWFFTYGKTISGSEYADGTATKTKILPRTVSNFLALADATAINLTTDERSLKPNPVRNVLINSGYLTDVIGITDNVQVDFSESNRTTEGLVIAQDEAGVTPEDTTTYTVRFYATESGSVLLHTESGVTAGTGSKTVTMTTGEEIASPNYLGHLALSYRVEIDVVRDGLTSTTYIRELTRPDAVGNFLITEDGDFLITEGGDFLVTG